MCLHESDGRRYANVNQVRDSATRTSALDASALTLFSDFQPLFGSQFSQSLLCAPRSEQRDVLRSEPLLGDTHQLLERRIACLAEELDRSRGLPEPHPIRQVVDDAAPTRPRTARVEGPKLLVTALDNQSPRLPAESTDCPLVSPSCPCGQELLPGPRMYVNVHRPPFFDRRPEPSLGSLPLERKHSVHFVFVAPGNRHRGNRVMPQLEMSSMRGSGRVNL